MFDLIAGEAKHLPSHPALPLVISTTLQAMAIGSVIAVPLLFLADPFPEVPTMMAFVAEVPAPPSPPPPPPAPRARKPPTPAPPAPASGQLAPLEAPERIEPEVVDEEGFDEGVEGGVEGGLSGGLVGGVVGGLPDAPPPPPPPAPRAPVRVGGQIQAPALLHRVEPVYPPFAVNAHLQGVVILEALVDEDGSVAEVKVLRSATALLDNAALVAVRQWRYSPLLLNGIRTRFVLTVVLSFNVTEAKE